MNHRPASRAGALRRATVLTLLALGTTAMAWADSPELPPEIESPGLPTQAPLLRNLIVLDLTTPGGLRYGLDPASLSKGTDRILRYVVVILGANAPVQAWFEGLRCASNEVKTYARWSASQQAWQAVETPVWRALNDNQPSRHALVLARQGACPTGVTATATSVEDIVRALRARRIDVLDRTP